MHASRYIDNILTKLSEYGSEYIIVALSIISGTYKLKLFRSSHFSSSSFPSCAIRM